MALCDALLCACLAEQSDQPTNATDITSLRDEYTGATDVAAAADDEVLYSEAEHDPSSLSLNLSNSTAGAAHTYGLSRSVSLAPTKSTSADTARAASQAYQHSDPSVLTVPLPEQGPHTCEPLPANVIEASLSLLSPLEYPADAVVLAECQPECDMQLVPATRQVALWVRADDSLLVLSADGRAVTHYLNAAPSDNSHAAAEGCCGCGEVRRCGTCAAAAIIFSRRRPVRVVSMLSALIVWCSGSVGTALRIW